MIPSLDLISFSRSPAFKPKLDPTLSGLSWNLEINAVIILETRVTHDYFPVTLLVIRLAGLSVLPGAYPQLIFPAMQSFGTTHRNFQFANDRDVFCSFGRRGKRSHCDAKSASSRPPSHRGRESQMRRHPASLSLLSRALLGRFSATFFGRPSPTSGPSRSLTFLELSTSNRAVTYSPFLVRYCSGDRRRIENDADASRLVLGR